MCQVRGKFTFSNWEIFIFDSNIMNRFGFVNILFLLPELKESLARVGADLKQKLIDSVKYTWNSINEFARAHRSTAQEVESEIDEVIQEVAAANPDADKSDLGCE
jgi:hypothetical protein